MVLHVDLGDVDLLWEAIARRVLVDPVSRVRDLGTYGLNCEVNVGVVVRRRSAPVRTIWHYNITTLPSEMGVDRIVVAPLGKLFGSSTRRRHGAEVSKHSE